MKYQLKKPVKIGTAPDITELTFREEVCAGDLRGVKIQALQDPDTADILKLGGRLCAQPDEVMNRLGIADLLETTRMVTGFLFSGLLTGNEASQP